MERQFEIIKISTHPNSLGEKFKFECQINENRWRIIKKSPRNQADSEVFGKITSLKYFFVSSFDIGTNIKQIGIGTLLLDCVLEIMNMYEKEYSLPFMYLRGRLSWVDKQDKWKISLPFYAHYPLHINKSNFYYNNITVLFFYEKQLKLYFLSDYSDLFKYNNGYVFICVKNYEFELRAIQDNSEALHLGTSDASFHIQN